MKQWVSDIPNYSSQYGNERRLAFSVDNLRGSTNVFPHYGESVEAFELRTYGVWHRQSPSYVGSFLTGSWASKNWEPHLPATDFVDLKFDVAVIPSDVEIYETYNPGSVNGIWAFDRRRRAWSLLWETDGDDDEAEGCRRNREARLFRPQLRRISFRTDLLRLQFETSSAEYHVQIDAVCLLSQDDDQDEGDDEELEERVDPETERLQIEASLLEIRLFVDSLKLDFNPETVFRTFFRFMRHDYPLLLALYRRPSPRIQNGTFDTLPDDVLRKILAFLDLKSLCAVSGVNRHFYALTDDPFLYRRLDLKPYWSKIRGGALVRFFASRCDVLQYLNLSWCGSYGAMTPDHFAEIMDRVGFELLGLWLDHCQFVNAPVVQSLGRWCPMLKELSLCGVKLSWDSQRSPYFSLGSLHHLERLDLYRCDITVEPLINILHSCPGMKHLLIGSCSSITSMDLVASMLPVLCPNLVSLDVWRGAGLSVAGLNGIARCSLLEELNLGWTFSGSENGTFRAVFAYMCKSCPRLRKIDLSAVRLVGDAEVATLAACCRNLEQIELMGNRNLTALSVRSLLAACPNLRLLDVSYCGNVSANEVAFLRTMYREVTIICD